MPGVDRRRVAESAVGEVRRAAAVAAAGAGRRGARTTAGASTHDVRLFETGTRFSTSGETRAVAGVWCGAGAGAALVGGARPAGFLRREGRRRSARPARSASTLDYEPASVPYLVDRDALCFRLKPDAATEPGRASVRLLAEDRTSIGQIAPRDSRGARLPGRRRRCTRSSSTSTRWRSASAATICARNRCRASRRSCAICRCSSIAPCLRPRFVALSARRRLRDARARDRVRSLPRQGRAGRSRQPVAPPHVPLSRSGR